jgi:hypothetical protein
VQHLERHCPAGGIVGEEHAGRAAAADLPVHGVAAGERVLDQRKQVASD